MKMKQLRRRLLASTMFGGLLIISTSTMAQNASSALDPAKSPAGTSKAPIAGPVTSDPSDQDQIVVTGSLLKRTDSATPSPVSVLTSAALDARGVTTIQEGLQQLAANTGPALTNSFTANGAFAGGASAISIHGLSTNSTLTLFDGLRATYYPLADDGSRNFVDLNTIPDDIVERVEIVRDGASANYGADAIAGVVNIITKKQIQGILGRAEAGISQRGDAANQRLSLTMGVGDLRDKGYNFYVSGFYLRSEALYNSQRPYPFNTADRRGITYNGNTGPNDVINGLDINNQFPASSFGANRNSVGSTLYVRPYDATNTTALGRYQLLNPAGTCSTGGTYSPTANELGAAGNASLPTKVCQEDYTNRYGLISPNIERWGATARGTVQLNDTTQAYAQFNYVQSDTNNTTNPATIRANAPAGIVFPRYSTSSVAGFYGKTVLTLPVYVCARGTVGPCTATNGTINPNNPFAAQGQVARLLGALPNIIEYSETRNRLFRVAAGISGTLPYDIGYNLNFTASHDDLRRRQAGYVYIQHLLDVVNDGSFNFLNPAANTQAQLSYLAPTQILNSSSDLYEGEATFQRSFFNLPGGPIQVGVGAQVRYEAIDNPSGNPDYNGPTQRYFRLNAFGSTGSRTVYAGFYDIHIPVFKQFSVDTSGRYDTYSSGQSNFSPKVGAKFTPVRQIGFRGTYSRGFRIPAFAEANALPTTGFVNATKSIYTDTFLANYRCSLATYASCPQYITNAPYGLTSTGTPNLQAEKSESFTGGIILDLKRNFHVTVDYYNIRKTNAITTANAAPAIAAYYAGLPIPTGYVVTPDTADINNPGAPARIGFVQSGFVNANTIKSSGLDFGADLTLHFGDFTLYNNSEVNYVINLSTSFPDGTIERYAGTLGNFNLTSGSGTPRWHGNLQSTLSYHDVSLTAFTNWYGGYNLSAEDQTGPGTANKCGLSPGYVPCDVADYVTVDMTASIKVMGKATFYVNVINIADRAPPIDPVTYGAYLYNPVQGGTGIYGRSFRAGFKYGF